MTRWTEKDLAAHQAQRAKVSRADGSLPPQHPPRNPPARSGGDSGRLPVTLDLPAPPSVNRTRRVDWKAGRKFKGWTKQAEALVLASRCRSRDPQPRCVEGRIEIEIILSGDHTRIDLDNGLKWLIDFLRRIEVIEDDGPKHLRRLVVGWGKAPEGCRVIVRPFDA